MRVLLTSFLDNLNYLLPSSCKEPRSKWPCDRARVRGWGLLLALSILLPSSCKEPRSKWPCDRARVRGWGLLLALSILLPSPCKGARAGDGGFDHYEWDFGPIEESEGTVSHTFLLRNEGSGPLYVTRAIPSCTCITAQLPQEAILPGKTGELVVSFSPSGAVGETFRSLEVTDQEGRLIGTLNIRADVTPIDRSIQERYFYTLGDMLYANLTTVPFGYVYPGDTITKTVFLANASHEAISIETSQTLTASPQQVPFQPPFPNLQVGSPTSIAPGEELPLTLTYALPDESAWIGTLHDTLHLSINGKPALLPITTSAIVLSRMTQTADDAPTLRTYPSSGMLRQDGAYYTSAIEVHNDGKAPLQILKIEAPDGLNAIVDQETIAPGDQTQLRVSCKQAGKYRIRLFTNDPKRRYRDIDIRQ